MRYEVKEISGSWVIAHVGGVICEVFSRKSAAMKRFNHSYCGGV